MVFVNLISDDNIDEKNKNCILDDRIQSNKDI